MNTLTRVVAAGVLAVPCTAQSGAQKLVGSDTATFDSFGTNVALSGHTAVIGAPGNDGDARNAGAAYVYELTAQGWLEAERLGAALPEQDASLGVSVALDGERALLGAFRDEGQRGSAHVFERSGGGWSETAELTALDGAAGDELGWSVALAGDVAVVGAHGDDDAGSGSGAVYVFECSPSGWSQTAKLVAGDAGPSKGFGRSVAACKGVIVVGAHQGGDASAQQNTGAAYVFERVGSDWAETGRLSPSDGAAGDWFGWSVAIEGETVVAGAFRHAGGAGAAYVFERAGTDWTELQKLGASDADPDDWFGERVRIRGAWIAAGARRDDGASSDAGAAYFFERDGGAFVQRLKFTADDAADGDQLGVGLAIDSTYAAVGARFADDAGLDAGAVYVVRFDDLFESYCGCTAGAPCGNETVAGGCENSTGAGAQLVVSGTNHVALDDLVVTATGLPAGFFGLIYMGGVAGDVPFGDGLRCIGGGVFRFDVTSSGAGGEFAIGPGIVAFSESSFPAAGHIAAGETWRFQAWFRDPTGPCGGGFNLSDAVAVAFVP